MYENKASLKVKRPFIGIVFKINNKEYFAPLSSPK
nr:type III toxin-antitoxin system ToxN/AbiQ family toxin [Leptotrichia hongkongensis]